MLRATWRWIRKKRQCPRLSHILQRAFWILLICIQGVVLVLQWGDYRNQTAVDNSTECNGFFDGLMSIETQMASTVSFTGLIACSWCSGTYATALTGTLRFLGSFGLQQPGPYALLSANAIALVLLAGASTAIVRGNRNIFTDAGGTVRLAFFDISASGKEAYMSCVVICGILVFQVISSASTLLFGKYRAAAELLVRNMLQCCRATSGMTVHLLQIQVDILREMNDQLIRLSSSINDALGWPLVNLFIIGFLAIVGTISYCLAFGQFLNSAEFVVGTIILPLYYSCLMISTVIFAEQAAEQRFKTIDAWNNIMAQFLYRARRSKQEGPNSMHRWAVPVNAISSEDIPDHQLIANSILAALMRCTERCKYFTVAKFISLNRIALLQMVMFLVSIVSFMWARRGR